MDLRIEYEDKASAFLLQAAQDNPKWIASALKSAAWKSQRVIKEGIKSGAPNGKPYAPRSLTPKQRRLLEAALGHTPKRTYPLMGRLRQAVGYDSRRAKDGIVTVGWLSKSAVLIGSKQQEGFQTPISDKTRRAFAAAGIILRRGTTMTTTAARPTFPVMLPKVQQVAADTVREKIISYVMGNTSRSAKTSTRTYKVYQ